MISRNSFNKCLVISIFLFHHISFGDQSITMEAESCKNPSCTEIPTVVVIGSGAAGLSVAIEASLVGAHVIILEKESKLGGNSAKATSGINGVSTSAQYEQGVFDHYKNLRDDTSRVGQGLGDPRLVDILSRHSTSAIQFLRGFGLSLTDVSQCGGHSQPRTHRCPPGQSGQPLPVGFTIIKQLQLAVSKIPNIKVINSSEVQSLIWENSNDGKHKRVYGVIYSQGGGPAVSLYADSVVLATGGMSFDRSKGSLLEEFAPSLCDLPTTSGPHADGKGIRMGREIGAKLVDMDKVQIHPTGLVHPKMPSSLTKFLCPEAVRGSGAIMVNDKGIRFVNELANRQYVTDKIFQNCEGYKVPLDSGRAQQVAYLLLNDEGAQLFGIGALRFYIKQGLFQEFDNAVALAEGLGLPIVALRSTISNYSEAARIGRDDLGKTVFPVKQFTGEEKLYVALVTPVIHYNMGGLKIDSSAQVQWIRDDGQEAGIEGLFAAGEVSGGVHGGDRLAGNSLLDCVVFGRIAGKRAGVSVGNVSRPALSTESWVPLKLRHKICTTAPFEDCDGGLFELSFDLPSQNDLSGVGLRGVVEVRASINGETVTKKFTPISDWDARGHIDLWTNLRAHGGGLDRYLYYLQLGEELEFRALDLPSSPLDSINQPSPPSKLLLIAHGADIAPILQLLQNIQEGDLLYEKVLVVWCVRSSKDVRFKNLFDSLKGKGVVEAVHYVIEGSMVAENANATENSHLGILDEELLRSIISTHWQIGGEEMMSTRVVLGHPQQEYEPITKNLLKLGFSLESISTFR